MKPALHIYKIRPDKSSGEAYFFGLKEKKLQMRDIDIKIFSHLCYTTDQLKK